MANGHFIPAKQLSSDSQERIVRRLKRDHEAEYMALERGEYPSPRAPGLFDLPRLKEVGANQHSEERGVDNVHLIPSNQLNSNSQERIVRRLKRDHAAMKAAGFVKMPRHGRRAITRKHHAPSGPPSLPVPGSADGE